MIGLKDLTNKPYGKNYSKMKKNFLKSCCLCGNIHGNNGMIVVVHHRDGNCFNDDVDNLEYLCRHCHNKAHRKLSEEKGIVPIWKKQLSEWYDCKG